MPALRIGRRGQITIPSALRRQLRLEEGQQLMVQVRDGQLVLRPTGRSLQALRGSIPVEAPQDFEAIRAQVRGERALRTSSDPR
ncbi:MAG: AbrB/MazE/SpoVT family DNA-binding domain-containing protein [Thermoleophilia bacterium]|nr:AbrB/MazE/SpoVT family DNA-binding domain-containing protein [Thermoleophilia bacterium]